MKYAAFKAEELLETKFSSDTRDISFLLISIFSSTVLKTVSLFKVCPLTVHIWCVCFVNPV